MRVAITPGSLAAHVWGTAEVRERFTCSYELNPEFEPMLTRHGLTISGRADGGEARIIELPRHRFFIATLFQPQLRSTPHAPHPLITSFVKAALEGERSPVPHP
jgi:CTP synthase (UTP-ammonia lyase)